MEFSPTVFRVPGTHDARTVAIGTLFPGVAQRSLAFQLPVNFPIAIAPACPLQLEVPGELKDSSGGGGFCGFNSDFLSRPVDMNHTIMAIVREEIQLRTGEDEILQGPP